ncbi:MAG TPA: mechanosensitive ion channel protein MscS, partial [Gallionella sp.]|nr:mechanosensitive ion channel protein MscS [Gallionella sp.]
MSFWDATVEFSWRAESLPVLVIALCIGFLSFHYLRDERKSIVNTLSLFFACLIGQFIAGLLHAMQFDTVAAVLHEAF